MGHKAKQDLLNAEHCVTPVPGDFWHERFSGYHVVLAFDAEKQEVTICSEKKYVDDGYTFDVTKAEVISLQAHKDIVCYKTLAGFVADVNPSRLPDVVEEWVAKGSPVWVRPVAPDFGKEMISVPKDLLVCILDTYEFIAGCGNVAILDPIAMKEQSDGLRIVLGKL